MTNLSASLFVQEVQGSKLKLGVAYGKRAFTQVAILSVV